MTVGELLARVSSRELSEWMEYARMEPFGEERADLRAGIIASTTANLYRKKGKKPLQPQDFMPKFGEAAADREGVVPAEARQARPSAEMLKTVELLNAAFGGKDLRAN